MSRNEQKIGKAGERIALAHLHSAGILMLAPVATPLSLIRLRDGLYRVVWREKVGGDFRGITKTGVSVLVEVKTVRGRNLRWSDFRPHQPRELSEHSSYGGLSLVAWVHDECVFLLRWPIPGFGPRTSLSPDVARNLSVRSV